ncbi:MAG TPA: hypothetical protein VIV11_00005, partial [Kofleriaceae bacterium]
MSGPICTLVEDAVACVAAECPAAYAEMEQQLGWRRFDLAIDDEHFMLDLGATALHGSVLSIATSVDTLAALVFGECGVLEAAEDGRLDVVASADDLIAAAAAMTSFLQGALRCIS